MALHAQGHADGKMMAKNHYPRDYAKRVGAIFLVVKQSAAIYLKMRVSYFRTAACQRKLVEETKPLSKRQPGDISLREGGKAGDARFSAARHYFLLPMTIRRYHIIAFRRHLFRQRSI